MTRELVGGSTAADPALGNSAAVLRDVARRADEVITAAEFAAQQAIQRAQKAARVKTNEAIQHLERVQEEADQLEAIALSVVRSANADADAMVASARCKAAIIVDDSRQQSLQITEGALQTAADLHETSYAASEELLASARTEADEILAAARASAQRILQDANGQVTGIDERPRESVSFSAMWESAHDGVEIEDFFAGMSERRADEVFKK